MSRLRYTVNYQRKAVKLMKKGLTVAAAAHALGVSRTSVYRWLNLDRQGKLNNASPIRASAEQRKIAHLQAELVRMRAKVDSLGIATAYFAKAWR